MSYVTSQQSQYTVDEPRKKAHQVNLQAVLQMCTSHCNLKRHEKDAWLWQMLQPKKEHFRLGIVIQRAKEAIQDR